MSEKEHIRALMREAELYRSQGLFEASKQRYEEILQLIQGHERLSKNKKLIDAVNRKIRTLEKNLTSILSDTGVHILTEEMQNLIRKLFSFSKNEATAAMEGAIALAKFGQYEKAVAEFQRLLKQGILPLEAAKNILRSHLSLSPSDVAIAQFERWASDKEFSKADLKYLRDFLENTLKKRGIKADLPEVGEAPHETAKAKKKQEEGLDISSIGVQLDSGPLKGKALEFEVTFQSGNTVSVIIPASHKDLVDAFEPGLRLAKVQCYSHIAVFNGSATVSEKVRITSGPREGDYSVDLTIDAA